MSESDGITITNISTFSEIPPKTCLICEDEFVIDDYIVEKVMCNDAGTYWDLWRTESVHLRCAFRGDKNG